MSEILTISVETLTASHAYIRPPRVPSASYRAVIYTRSAVTDTNLFYSVGPGAMTESIITTDDEFNSATLVQITHEHAYTYSSSPRV